jgi:tryptophan-rich sensory protein
MIVWYKLIISLIICVGIGALSGFFTQTGEGSWYEGINKPSFNPPSWVFGPVWTLLYILMGIVLYILWTNNAKIVLIFFAIQLALNFFWSLIFFGLQSPLLAFIEMMFLLAAIIITAVYAYPVSKATIWLLLPYMLWVGFATILTLSIYMLNG